MVGCSKNPWELIFRLGDAEKCHSRHMFDQYSLTHAATGAIVRRTSNLTLQQALVIHTIFEVIENIPVVHRNVGRNLILIDRYNGDSIWNVIGDTISHAIGYSNPGILYLTIGLFAAWYSSVARRNEVQS